MPCTSPDNFHQKSFRIKHDDTKFFTRLLSKENSKSNSSFRVYYGDVSSSVPFTWETRPGTPKHPSSQNSHILPLTPPPSYYTNNFENPSKKHPRSKLILHNLLRRMNPKKASSHSSSSSLSSISWPSSSRSSFSDAVIGPNTVHKRRRFSSWGSSFDGRGMHDRREDVWPSKMCFGGGGERAQGGGYSVLIVKKALLSIVGRGSAA